MKKNNHAVLRVFLLLAILCAVVLLGQRFAAEQKDRACSIAFLQEDLAFLAEANGLSQDEFLDRLDAGTVYVIREGLGYDDQGKVAFAAGIQAESMDTVAAVDPRMPLTGQASVGLTQLVIENITRAGIHGPADFDVESFGFGGQVLRGLYLFPTYRNRLTGDDPAAISNLLFLAATDRGMRLLILRPFEDRDTGAVCTDPAVYQSCLADLRGRLEARGLTLGQGISIMEAPTRSRSFFRLLEVGVIPAFAGVWLLCRWEKLRKHQFVLSVAAMVCMATVWVILPGLGQKLVMLAAALSLPAIGVIYLAKLAKTPSVFCKNRPFPAQALVFSIAVVGWALASGLCVAALMCSRVYLLSADIFSGVKLALLGPVGLMALLLIWQSGKELIPRDRKSFAALGAVLAVALIIAAGLVLRSGDSTRASALESTVRVWLERTLYARPRTKELLLATPCVPLYLWACRKELPQLKLLTGIGCALELTSVCNTFCHATAPLRVSVIRTLLGAGIGFVLGLAACGILQLIWQKYHHNDNDNNCILRR